MPPHFLKQMYHLEYVDDKDEYPLAFNQDLDIWEFQKEEISATEQLSAQQKAKYVFLIMILARYSNIHNILVPIYLSSQENIFNMNFEDLMELSRARREEATRRKNKRDFMNMEKNIYMTEMSKRAEIIKEKASKLIQKDKNSEVIPLIVVEEPVADLEDKDVPVVVRKPKAFLAPPSSLKGDRKTIGSAKTKSFMERFHKDEPRPRSVSPTRPKSSSISNMLKGSSNSARRSRISIRKKSTMESMQSLLEEENESEEGSDSEDSFLLEGSEYGESGASSPISDLGFHHLNFFGDSIDEEEHHRDLIDASAKEFDMIVQAHDQELKLKRLQEAADKKAKEQKKIYQAGMLLPNSMGLADVLGARRGSRALVKNEDLFKKANLEEMYIARSKNSSSAPPIIKAVQPKPRSKGPRAKTEPVASNTTVVAPLAVQNELIPVAEDQIEEEPEMDDQAILASIVGTKKKVDAIQENIKVEPAPEQLPRKKTFLFDADWDQSQTDTSSAVAKLNTLAPLPTIAKQPPKPVSEARKQSIFNTFIDEPEVAEEEKPLVTAILGEDATKKLIHIHGMEESETNRVASPKRKSKKPSSPLKPRSGSNPELIKEEVAQGLKKKKKTKDDQVVFEPSKYVKVEDSVPTPLLKAKRKKKEGSRPQSTTKTSVDSANPQTASARKEMAMVSGRPLQKPSSPQKKTIEMKPFFPKGKVFARRNSIDEKDVVKPILDLLSDVNAPLDKNITITTISSIVQEQLKIGDSKKILDALDALVSLHKMFADDIRQEEQFDTFIAPLLDSFLSEDAFVRKKVINCIVDMGIRHDSSLTLLICALNERDKTIVQSAIKGLANYGIADKEGLKRGMVELGMMKGTNVYSTNENLEVTLSIRYFLLICVSLQFI